MTEMMYRDEVPQPIVVAFLQNVEENFNFICDNAQPLRAVVVVFLFKNHRFNSIDQPAKSSHLQLIKYILDKMKRIMKQSDIQQHRLQQLVISLKAARDRLTVQDIKYLIIPFESGLRAIFFQE